MASMFDLVMNSGFTKEENSGFTKEDWSRLGQGDTDGLDVEAMLAEGYENIVDESDDENDKRIEF